MKIFDVQGRVVVINTNCLLVPELKAVVDEYPDCYLNVLSFIHFLTDPDSPYDRVPEDKKEGQLKKDYPGKYSSSDTTVRDAIEKVREIFMELPEDRIYRAAKVAAGNAERALELLSENLTELKDVDTVMKILKQIQSVSESLGQTRHLRDSARQNQKARGNVKIASDQRRGL